MQDFPALLGILATLALGMVSPGPSFLLVARTAMAGTRADGLCAALGMGVGGILFAIAALLGLNGLLLAAPALYMVFKLAGGLYLVYLGWRIWTGATLPLTIGETAQHARAALARSFALGFTTQVSNPKTAIVYASVFAAFLPAAHGMGFNLAVVVLVFAMETGWYAVVALVLSSHRPRDAYLRCKSWIDRVAGAVMTALGVKLMASA